MDPPLVPPIVVKKEIEYQVPEVKEVYSPTPVTLQLDGVRVKLDYDEYHEKIGYVEVDKYILHEISEIIPSKMYNYTLVKLLPESSLW